jgi:hypothetical protein
MLPPFRSPACYLRDLTPKSPAGLFSKGLSAGIYVVPPLKSRSTQGNPRVGESGENQGFVAAVRICSGHFGRAFL